jgi:hypothetical protein
MLQISSDEFMSRLLQIGYKRRWYGSGSEHLSSAAHTPSYFSGFKRYFLATKRMGLLANEVFLN